MGKKTKGGRGGEAASAAANPVPAGPAAGTYLIDTGTAELIDEDGQDGAWLVMVNGVQSSHVVLGRPRELAFEYMRWFAAGVESFVGAHLDPARLRITHLGGGACSMARYLADVYPESRNTVVELDGRLAALVREQFDIPRAPRVKIRVGEARAVTEGFVDGSRDVVIRDVFADAVTPGPLTTVEFFAQVRRALAPGGLYVANCGDGRGLTLARAEIAGLREVFAHVACIADPPMLKGRRYGNIVLLASDSPLPRAGDDAAAALGRVLLGGAVPAQYKDEEWARRLALGSEPRRD
ncbi:fused MFS/spermidine synthase [Rothia sp. AR01]|uniref:Fused MFS/spermidine synthase n=1 Tax=Rothia santali TaxID=2949643 RepID=A0A9X2KIJ0_9MICC|nr:fused MFS/spermidine synthase [Rothia santali]MCP3425889.1 fused MFS/spermidine synthase [Rothia santali]